MIVKKNIHNDDLYNIILILSRNIFFYKKINLPDTFESRLYLMFFHFSIMMIISKKKGQKFSQKHYDLFFRKIEYNLRELGFGDVSVNKKMKEMNKIFYDILLKHQINKLNTDKINEKLVLKYFPDFNNAKTQEFKYFETYFIKFYQFCFELSPDNMIREAIKFKL